MVGCLTTVTFLRTLLLRIPMSASSTPSDVAPTSVAPSEDVKTQSEVKVEEKDKTAEKTTKDYYFDSYSHFGTHDNPICV